MRHLAAKPAEQGWFQIGERMRCHAQDGQRLSDRGGTVGAQLILPRADARGRLKDGARHVKTDIENGEVNRSSWA